MTNNVYQVEGTAWPGTYTLEGSGGFWAPRPGGDGRYYGIWFEYNIPPTVVTILDHQITDVGIPMIFNKTTVQGNLLAADSVMGEDMDLLYEPVSNKTVQFVVHAEIESWFPSELRTIETMSDGSGAYGVELWPGPYGIRVPDRGGEMSLANYWSEKVVIRSSTQTGTGNRAWPYAESIPAGWPGSSTDYSPYVGGLGWNMDGKDFVADLLLRKRDTFNIRGFIRHEDGPGALRDRVVFVKPDDTILSAPTDELLMSETEAELLGPGGTRTNGIHVYDAGLSCLYTNIPVGEYSLQVQHDRYEQKTNITFTCFDWGLPGHLPSSKPPSSSDVSRGNVLLPLQMNTFRQTGDKAIVMNDKSTLSTESNVTVTIAYLEAGTGELRSYQTTPRFVRESEYGNILFKYGAYVFPDSQSVIVLHNADGQHRHFLLEGTNRYVEALSGTEVPINTAPYRLTVEARQEAMRELVVTGLTFKITGDGGQYETPCDFPAYSGDAILEAPTNSNWAWKHTDYELVSGGGPGGTPQVKATVFANLIFNLTGEVLSTVGAIPVSLASVSLRRADGGRLPGAPDKLADRTTGAFVFSGLQEGFRDYYVEASALGYLPKRVRFSPGVPPAYTGARPVLALPEPVRLSPIAVQAANTDFDRFGYVLGGVKAVGSDQTTNALIMTWSTDVTAAHGSYTMPAYDNADGSSNEAEVVTYSDRLAQVWLIDARAGFFGRRDRTMSDREPQPLQAWTNGLPDNERYPGNQLRLPNPDDPYAVRLWLHGLEQGQGADRETGASQGISSQTMFYRRHVDFRQSGTGRTHSVTGRVSVADMPRGEFRPIVAVLTERGAAKYQFVSPGTNSAINVLRLPTWLAFVADMITMAGNAQSTYSDLHDTYASNVPDGRLSALPEFSGSITQENGYMSYEYDVGVKWTEGGDAPGSGLLSLGPGIVGIEFEAGASIEFEGRTPSLGFGVRGQMGVSEVALEDFAPNITENLGIEGEITEVSGQARTVRSVRLSGAQWTDHELRTMVGANLEGYMRYNLSGLTQHVPYVGPVLLVADRSGALSFYARADMAVRVEAHEVWRTLEPERTRPAFLIWTNGQNQVVAPTPGDHTVPLPVYPDPVPLTPTRHSLGGERNVTVLSSNSLVMGFNFGASLEAEALGGRLYGRAGIMITGDEETGLVNGKPSLRVVPNRYGDWPPIRRVTGQANAELEARLDLTITEISKTWTWPLLTIDAQFGTTNAMTVTDMGIVVRESGLGDLPPVQLLADGPILLDDCLPMQRYAVAGDGLAYLSYDSGTGEITIMFSEFGGAAWSTPVEVANAAQIVDLEMLQLPAPDGRWLIAWCEIHVNDLALQQPRCTVRYSVKDPGGWSAAQDVARLEGQLRDMQFAVGGDFVSLVYLENPEGFLSRRSRVAATSFGGTWSTPVVVREPAELPVFAQAGPGPAGSVPARAAYARDDLSVGARYWDGTRSQVSNGVESVDVDPGPAGPAMAMCAGDSNRLYLAWADSGTGIRLDRYTPDPAGDGGKPDYDWNSRPADEMWVGLGTVVSHASLTELQAAWLPGSPSNALLLAWSDGAELRCAFVDPLDASGSASRVITTNPGGRYRDLRIVPGPDLTATVLARFTGPVNQVRRFVVSVDDAIDYDSDGDGMGDAAELNMADFTTNDGVNVVSDIDPGGDFDGDGVTNGLEIAEGSDPTDPDSMPHVDGVEILVGFPRGREDGGMPASVIVRRAEADDGSVQLEVMLEAIGSATPGDDYPALPGTAVIPVGEESVTLDVVPVADGVAESNETVNVYLRPGGGYTLGSRTNATVTIVDAAYDAWRHRRFTAAQLADPSVSGDDADPDGDGLGNLIEYGMGTDPLLAAQAPGFEFDIEAYGAGKSCVFTYRASYDAEDVVFHVEALTDIIQGTWVDITPDLDVVAREPGSGSEKVILVDPDDVLSGPSKFYRIKVVRE